MGAGFSRFLSFGGRTLGAGALLTLGAIASHAATADPGPIPLPDVVGGLQGCWNAPGSVRGKDAPSTARGDWRIGHLYFMLQLHSLVAAKPYTAAIIYGAGPKEGTIGSYWLDVYGGTLPTKVTGAPTKDGFTVAYDFGDSIYTNIFTKTKRGWTWTINEHFTGKPEKLFATYDLTPASCEGKRFEF